MDRNHDKFKIVPLFGINLYSESSSISVGHVLEIVPNWTGVYN